MRSVYKFLGYAISVLVAVQAAAIAVALFGLTKWVDDGGTLNSAAMESGEQLFGEEWGFMVHGIGGEMLIPLVALVLLIVSFFAKVPGGVKWAAFIVVDVILQVAFAFIAFGAPAVGVLHGLNALVLFGLGIMAARAAGRVDEIDVPAHEAELV